MRIHILSDLHLEFAPFQTAQVDADVVVLAGDIHVGSKGIQWARKQFPGKPVIYVLGNHEFYRFSLPGLTEELKQEAAGSQIHVLENGAVEIAGVTFLGCTLWTDFQISGNRAAAMRYAEESMSDYQIVRFDPEQRSLRARDTVQLHTESVTWLRGQLSQCKTERTVVVTHHAPSSRSEAPYHANSPLKPAFSSDLDEIIEQSGVPLWIYGHTHYNTDYRIGSTRVLTNQRGYPRERCKGFDPSLIVEI